MKRFFKGWHKPTVATTVVSVIVLIVLYHLVFHARPGGDNE